MSLPAEILIVGCGVFGLSTGLALSKRYPTSKITFIDRHEPPIPDGTSSDTTRVIRADYQDPIYAKLAFEAQELIQNDPELRPFYYRSGMIFADAGPGTHGSKSWEQTLQIARTNEVSRVEKGEFSQDGYIKELESHEAIFKRVNGIQHEPIQGTKSWNRGYCNEDVAFVDANKCMKAYYEKCRRQPNTKFIFGNSVERVIFEGKKARGVKLQDGLEVLGDLVILATGAWSNKLIDLRDRITATGHEVAWLKVSPEIAEMYKNMPITTNLTTGFNIFPPHEGEIKCLRRSPGYLNTKTLQHPETGKDGYSISFPPEAPSQIPAEAEKAMRENLAELFPPLAKQPFARTRICWFTNTPTSDFLIDRHPEYNNLVVATGGSAHGWKFLCVLGDKVVDMLEGKLQPDLCEKWKFRDLSKEVPDIQGAPRALGIRQELEHCKRIIIIGAGVFGLTSALHLVRSGYTDVTLFDYQNYDENGYAILEGCDAASADENKILRASYGSEKLYQEMAFGAMKHWEEWNEVIKSSTTLPAGVTSSDKVWINSGFTRLGDTDGLDDHEIATQANFPKELRHTQYRITDPKRRQDAAEVGIPTSKLDPFNRESRNLKTEGMFDNTAGYVLASKACSWTLHLCKLSGVKTNFGPPHRLQALLSSDNQLTGIKSIDGTTHPADLVIIAAGGWTPSIIPDVSNILETTAGSVLTVQLPPNRKDLWEKFDPKNFPVWSWKMTGYVRNGMSSGGLYGFPRTTNGLIKIGFRGAKWTNYTFQNPDPDNEKLISYPKTDIGDIPARAMDVIHSFCEENLPELLECELVGRRLCWYTDSVDNSFLIDFVPGKKGLMVVSGGSGHGFKFLPVLGKHVVDVVQGNKTEYTEKFRWREGGEGKRNGLEEGPEGWRTLDRQAYGRVWKL